MIPEPPTPPPSRIVRDGFFIGDIKMVAPIFRQGGHKLTGKRRHRMGWRSKLVLQVEVTYYLYTWQDHGKPYGDEEWRFAWRDATINDINGELV